MKKAFGKKFHTKFLLMAKENSLSLITEDFMGKKALKKKNTVPEYNRNLKLKMNASQYTNIGSLALDHKLKT